MRVASPPATRAPSRIGGGRPVRRQSDNRVPARARCSRAPRWGACPRVFILAFSLPKDPPMMTSLWNRLLKRKSRPAQKKPSQGRFTPELEPLADRIVPAVTASFSPKAGVLSVFGDSQNNTIVVSRDAAGKILVNGDAVTIKGGTSTVAN